MASHESINEKLRAANENLDQAAREISALPLAPTSKHIGCIGAAIGNILQIQHEIYRLRPDLQSNHFEEGTRTPDTDLTPEQKELVRKLSKEEIDRIDSLLLSHAKPRWRKVAMLVGLVMSERGEHLEGIPDVFYSQRVRTLVDKGCLESQGNLQYMRFSEVRISKSDGARET